MESSLPAQSSRDSRAEPTQGGLRQACATPFRHSILQAHGYRRNLAAKYVYLYFHTYHHGPPGTSIDGDLLSRILAWQPAVAKWLCRHAGLPTCRLGTLDVTIYLEGSDWSSGIWAILSPASTEHTSLQFLRLLVQDSGTVTRNGRPKRSVLCVCISKLPERGDLMQPRMLFPVERH